MAVQAVEQVVMVLVSQVLLELELLIKDLLEVVQDKAEALLEAVAEVALA
jgi:phage-related protein